MPEIAFGVSPIELFDTEQDISTAMNTRKVSVRSLTSNDYKIGWGAYYNKSTALHRSTVRVTLEYNLRLRLDGSR